MSSMNLCRKNTVTNYNIIPKSLQEKNVFQIVGCDMLLINKINLVIMSILFFMEQMEYI